MTVSRPARTSARAVTVPGQRPGRQPPLSLSMNLTLLQQNLAQTSFSILDAEQSETFTIREVVQIMVRFPNGVCNLPYPADLCELDLNFTSRGELDLNVSRMQPSSFYIQQLQDHV